MSDLTERLRDALSFDPLAHAEEVTGQSYKDDEDTMRLGFGLALMHDADKERLLREGADSYFNMRFGPSLDLFADLGFAEVYRETFAGNDGPDEFVILWHPEGILATCESYGEHRNSAKAYYNFRHESGGYPHRLTSSGRMHGDVWIGDHDAREGVRLALRSFRAEGGFLPEWVERPFLWLLNYSETKGDYDYAAINAAKIAQLPAHVQAAISPERAA